MRLVRMRQFCDEDEHVEWLVDGLLPNTGWTLFYGERGVGKTTFAVQLAIALQSGEMFLDRKVQQCHIVYIQADSDSLEWREILRRIDDSSLGWTIVDVPDHALDNPKYQLELKDYLSRLCQYHVYPSYVIWDSYYKLTNADINNAKALLPIGVMKAICSYNHDDVTVNIPFMVIHHPRKDGDIYSGHNSLGGNCSNEWQITQTKLNIRKGRLVRDKEIMLYRDEQDGGLWHLQHDDYDSLEG